LQAVKFLEASGNDLDYRRYADTFFDVLIAGGMLGMVALLLGASMCV
jgi:hypothetical protein